MLSAVTLFQPCLAASYCPPWVAFLLCCCGSCSLKTIVSLMYPPEQLAAAAIYFGYVALGLQPPPDKDGRSFCEYTRTPADALQGENLDLVRCGAGGGGPASSFLVCCTLVAHGRCCPATDALQHDTSQTP